MTPRRATPGAPNAPVAPKLGSGVLAGSAIALKIAVNPFVPNAVAGTIGSSAARVFKPGMSLRLKLPWASTPSNVRKVTISSLDAGGPPTVSIQDPSGVLYPAPQAVASAVRLGANTSILQAVSTSGVVIAATASNSVILTVTFATAATSPQLEVIESSP